MHPTELCPVTTVSVFGAPTGWGTRHEGGSMPTVGVPGPALLSGSASTPMATAGKSGQHWRPPQPELPGHPSCCPLPAAPCPSMCSSLPLRLGTEHSWVAPSSSSSLEQYLGAWQLCQECGWAPPPRTSGHLKQPSLSVVTWAGTVPCAAQPARISQVSPEYSFSFADTRAAGPPG